MPRRASCRRRVQRDSLLAAADRLGSWSPRAVIRTDRRYPGAGARLKAAAPFFCPAAPAYGGMKVRGGCHCGAVRFEAELPEPPVPRSTAIARSAR